MTAQSTCISVLRCPQCGSEPAYESPSQLQCCGCMRRFRVLEGIPSLALNPEYYYGEIPQNQMRQLLLNVQAGGLEHGMRESMQTAKDPAYFIDYAVRDGRAGWMFLLPLRDRARILDVGCGPGSLSISLARHGHQVFGMDLTLERVQFLTLRARLLGLDNVCGIHGGDGPLLPFASGAFDLVILNGVLEWLAQGKADVVPRDVQLRFLAETARVLNATGHIFIGIENRYGKDYFLGKLEEHARIPFVSLLPRKLADLYACAKTGRPYRTWTYSLPALSSLVRKAGFRRHTILLPIPDYRDFYRILEGDSNASVGTYLAESGKKRLFRALGGRKLIRYVAPSFGLVGSKATTIDPSWLSRLATEVPALRNGVFETYLVTSTDTVVAHVRSSSTSLVLRIPLNAAAYAACVHNQAAIQRLGERAEPWLPKFVASGEFEQSHYFIETALKGQPIPRALLPAAMRFLTTLHSIPIAACSWQDVMHGITSQLQSFFPERSILLDLVSYVEEKLLANRLPRVLRHGDYWRGNILAEGDQITGVVDWSDVAFGAPPMSDALHLLAFEHSEKYRVSIVTALMPFILGNMPGDTKRVLDGYVAEMKIDLDAATRGASAALYWLEYLAGRLGRPENRYALNPRWLRTHLSEPGRVLAGALGIVSSTATSQLKV